MSKQFDDFDRNIARVDSLCELFERSKESPRRPTVKEGDILRAAVVFLHSALENYLRGVLTQWLPTKADKEAIDRIALADSEGRAEKFNLGALKPFAEKQVKDLISLSVQQHMSKVSFNDFGDICSWIKKIQLNKGEFKEEELINNMIKRRHKIVHEADTNAAKGHGNHAATPIGLKTVKAWENAAIHFVNELEKQLAEWG